MYCFIKSLLIGAVVQAIALWVIFNAFSETLADSGLIWFLYIVPTILLSHLFQVTQPGQKIDISMIELVGLPVIFYSVLIGLTACLLKQYRNKGRTES